MFYCLDMKYSLFRVQYSFHGNFSLSLCFSFHKLEHVGDCYLNIAVMMFRTHVYFEFFDDFISSFADKLVKASFWLPAV